MIDFIIEELEDFLDITKVKVEVKIDRDYAIKEIWLYIKICNFNKTLPCPWTKIFWFIRVWWDSYSRP